MSNGSYPFDESLLQWIWQNLEFSTKNLRTQCGKSVTIVEQGVGNTGGGPDFSGAVIGLDGLLCHGDIELHIVPGGWAEHKHERSERYNRVVLHVVFEDEPGKKAGKALRPDGTTPPLLELSPHLDKPLQQLFKRSKSQVLPCAGNIQFINQRTFEEQIEKAHKNYFEYKVAELLERYPAHLPVPDAWRHLFSAGIFHTLGIPGNRKSMLQFHDLLTVTSIRSLESSATVHEYIERAYSLAFDQPGSDRDTLMWESTGMRPASRPAERVGQAAALHYSICRLPFKSFLDPELSSWDKIMKELPAERRPGKQMAKILWQTTFLPAQYLLGDLLHSARLKSRAYSEWHAIYGGVPAEVKKPFRSSGFKMNHKTVKPGLAHQLKRYCRAGKCHQCEVFKKAICS